MTDLPKGSDSFPKCKTSTSHLVQVWKSLTKNKMHTYIKYDFAFCFFPARWRHWSGFSWGFWVCPRALSSLGRGFVLSCLGPSLLQCRLDLLGFSHFHWCQSIFINHCDVSTMFKQSHSNAVMAVDSLCETARTIYLIYFLMVSKRFITFVFCNVFYYL